MGNSEMRSNKYTIAAVIIASTFWFFDAAIHYFVYGEPQFQAIPGDFNELWMRVVIVLLLITIGVYADITSRKLINKEKQLEAIRVYTSMVGASRHILNNLLNQMQLVKMEAVNSRDFDQEFIKCYDDAFDEAKELIKKLSEIEHVTDENIWASVVPGAKASMEDETSQNAS